MTIHSTGKHQASKKGYIHTHNPSSKPSAGGRQKVAPRKTRNTKADR